MKLTSTEEYGLRCLLQLARRHGQGPVGIRVVAESEGISEDYVAKLLRILRRGGLLESTRGAQGGYELVRAPHEITVWDAMAVLGGRIFDAGFCESHTGAGESCAHTSACSLKPLWSWLDHALEQSLSQVTLADCLAGPTLTTGLSLGRTPPMEASP
ncbi:MAG: Rrf2 family transcriptional regulator [Deltaproteobacteria bacterium]|nr:MAG: Rrf2 family transcriptional regulator [Deltaproteobacteria bacterium]